MKYTAINLLAHSVQRVRQVCPSLIQFNVHCDEVRLVNPKLFGGDDSNALLTSSIDRRDLDSRDTIGTTTHPFVLHTSDGGKTWLQVLNLIGDHTDYISDVKCIGEQCLLLHEHSGGGHSFGFYYSSSFGRGWRSVALKGITGSYYLVDWSIRRPFNAIAVVGSDSGIPIDGDISRETAFWVIESEHGPHWNISSVIEHGKESYFDASDTVWPPEWDENSSLWRMVTTGHSLTVFRQTTTGEEEVVLALPMGRLWKNVNAPD